MARMTTDDLLRDLIERITRLENTLHNTPRKPQTTQAAPMPDKTCPECGTNFNRHRRTNGKLEPRSVYTQRPTCGSPECRIAHGNRTRTTQRLTITTKPCEICRQTITPRPGEGPSKYHRRRSCDKPDCRREIRSQGARAGNTTRQHTPRNCQACGNPIPHRRNDHNYSTRSTCGSPACVLHLKRRANAARTNTPLKPPPAPWTPAEDAIIRATYPRLGLRATVERLADLGRVRPPRLVTARADHFKLAPPADAFAQVLNLLTDFGGLPLCLEDVRDELGVNRKAVANTLRDLEAHGLIARRLDPEFTNRHLYFVPTRDAA
jgi:hypothetical protein